jgi:hypothetical protein
MDTYYNTKEKNWAIMENLKHTIKKKKEVTHNTSQK